MKEAIFVPSALQYGDTVEDFYETLAGRPLKIRSRRGFADVYELLGRNLAGDYLHIVYRMLVDGRLRVFHMNRRTDSQKRATGVYVDEKKNTGIFHSFSSQRCERRRGYSLDHYA